MGSPKHCSSPSHSPFPAFSSSSLLKTKDSSLCLDTKMLHILILACFLSKFFPYMTYIYSNWTAHCLLHTPQKVSLLLLFSLRIMFYPAYQYFAHPSRFKSKCFYFLDILKFTLTSSVWKCLPFSSPSSQNSSQHSFILCQLYAQLCAKYWI